MKYGGRGLIAQARCKGRPQAPLLKHGNLQTFAVSFVWCICSVAASHCRVHIRSHNLDTLVEVDKEVRMELGGLDVHLIRSLVAVVLVLLLHAEVVGESERSVDDTTIPGRLEG